MMRRASIVMVASLLTTAMCVGPAAGSTAPTGRWLVCGEWRQVAPRFSTFTPESVAVVSPYEAWVVGGPIYSSGPAIALRWDGLRWVQTTVPLPPKTDRASLNDAAVVSSDDVWAVGVAQGSPLTVRWSGTAWHRVPIGIPGLSGSLEGIARIPGTNALWAVGFEEIKGTQHTLVLRWNGQTWRRVASPDPSDHGNLLADVAVVGDVAWAVGARYGPDTEATLIERWSGRAWRVVDAPSPGKTETTELQAVAGLRPDQVWAVGWYQAPSTPREHGVILRWDGDRWAVAKELAGGTALLGLVVASPLEAWAVGRYRDHDRTLPLVFRRDGGEWVRSASPRPDIHYGTYRPGTYFVAVDGTPHNLWAPLRIQLEEGSFTSTYHRC